MKEAAKTANGLRPQEKASGCFVVVPGIPLVRGYRCTLR
jgi:hypothetical protein